VVQPQSLIRPLASRLVQGVVGVYRGPQPSLTRRSICWSKLSNVSPFLLAAFSLFISVLVPEPGSTNSLAFRKLLLARLPLIIFWEDFAGPCCLTRSIQPVKHQLIQPSVGNSQKSCTKNITLKGGQSEIADLHSDKQVPIVVAAVLIHATTFEIKLDSSMI
jgi:hypothetical protein